MGHQRFGTGRRHGTGRARLWPRMVDAVGLLPERRLTPPVRG
jgi:hypothetical protein